MAVERITAELFAADGTTSLGTLDRVRNVRWQDELSKTGSASFEVPLEDAGDIADDCIVKFSLWGAVRFGCRIVSESCSLAVDGRRWLRFENQPGGLTLLGDATIYPAGGIGRFSDSQRMFGFMSRNAEEISGGVGTGAWYVDADWDTPTVTAFVDGIHAFQPPELRPWRHSGSSSDPDTPDLFWIAPDPGPETTVADDFVFWARWSIGIADVATKVMFLAAGDNHMTMWIDGEEVISRTDSWRTASTVTRVLEVGTHVVAIMVENEPQPKGYEGAPNPVGLVLAMTNVDTQGNPHLMYRGSDAADDWKVSTVRPGWHRASVLLQLFLEARDRGCPGPLALTTTFDDTTDTASASWDDIGEFSFPVASINVDEAAMQLSESVIDVEVNLDTMTFDAWRRRGSDLSATVILTLGDVDPTSNLKAYETTRSAPLRTVALAQLSTGQWLETVDSDAVTASGRKEIGIAIGSISDADTATATSETLLAQLAVGHVQMTGETSTLQGARPYVDYDKGDTVGAPAHRNAGTTKGRVMAINVDGTGDVIRAWPELVEDLSG